MMKKILPLFILSVAFSFAQEKAIMVDTVINVEGSSKDVLYDRVHGYLTSGINSQKQKEYLFKEEDKENGAIKIKGKFKNKTKVFSGSAIVNKDVDYDYEVYFKDNKIRLIVENFYHPYFGPAIDELPYPKGTKTGINGKKWYGKVYSEYHANTIEVLNNIIRNTSGAVLTKDKSEEDW